MHKLYNNHNVYILGAGFSVDRGLPTIRNFMLVMRDAHEWLESQNRTLEANAIKDVLDFRLDAASAAYRIKLDLENIEELFSLASASSRKLTKQIRIAIAATLDYKIKTTLEPNVGFQINKKHLNFPDSWKITDNTDFVPLSGIDVSCPAYEFYLQTLLGSWSNKNQINTNTIISFNYDLIVEDALKKLSIPYRYGIEPKESTSEDIQLLKLHGSINWGLRTKSTSYEIYSTYSDLLDSGLSPQIVPPTWRKIFTGQLTKVWDNSLDALEKATRIIVIGFSMPETDSHFKYLMASGLQKNVSLREILFVNPDKETVASRAKKLFGDSHIVGHPSPPSTVKIIGTSLSSFLSQGLGNIGSYGRPLPREIQNIHLSY